MERLSYEDVHVAELVVDKINEIIDFIKVLDEKLSSRIDNNWKHHRQLSYRLEELEEMVKGGTKSGKESEADPKQL